MNTTTPVIRKRNKFNDDNPKYMSVEWMADMLGINLAAAYALVKQPGFPAIRISPRRIVIVADALDRWMTEHATGA